MKSEKTIPAGAVKKLGSRLADLLDEDHFAECEKLLLAAQTEIDRAERRAIMFGDSISNQCIAMQAALIEARLSGNDRGMEWIKNTLDGPGLLPDLEEAKKLGGAQAWFNAKTAEHDEFRKAHPGPVVPNAEVRGA